MASLSTLARTAAAVLFIGGHVVVASVNEAYDYVIAGGGLTGLVVANRLTEDAGVSVLVVEWGQEDLSWTAAAPYYANTLQLNNMLSFSAEAIPGLNNRASDASIGAVVGGGSTVNGMAFERGSKADYDAWEELGNPGWNWDEMLKYFRKSTTYTPPDAEFDLPYEADSSSFGEGPIQVGFPRWRWPDADLMRDAWKELDIPQLPEDGSSGDNVGLAWATSNIDQQNFTRSNARTNYYVPASSRSNLKLLTRHYASRVLFEDGDEGKKASGLTIVSRDTNETITVTASKEVILATGAIQTPKLLQLSGVGPSFLLESLGIDVVSDLPGVGANFQDHPWFSMTYEFQNETEPNFGQLSDADYFDAAWDEYIDNRTGPITHARSHDIVFLSLSDLVDTDGSAGMLNRTLGQLVKSISCQNPLDYLPDVYSVYDTLAAGFKAQSDILMDRFRRTDNGVAEFPFSGSPAGTVALQKPLSRGLIHITADNVGADVNAMTTSPSIQFNTFANPIDSTIAVLGLRKTREFYNAAALAVREPVEVTPGSNVTSDDALAAALRDMVFPSFSHPSGTASMLPLEFGGVVDPQLRVYGVQGLRVVDASILPLIPACHLQATMYAVAEKAADLIKADA